LSNSCFEPVASAVRDVDQLVRQTPLVAVGRFRCPPAHPRFADSGPIRNHCFVFPRTASVIEHESGDRFVGDQTKVSLYNPGQAYRRRSVSREGDHSDYFVVTAPLLREALAARRLPSAEADDRRLFPRSHTPSRADLYLRQRRLFRASVSAHTDTFEVETGVLGLLDDVVCGMAGEARSVRPSQQRLVERAEALLADRFARALSLHDVAAELDVSPFHLCRVFRAATGRTLHQHREQLRLRAALNRLEGSDDITTIALDCGYSSHSHFTAAFHKAFGIPPSIFRRCPQG
jgi:AraC family transcriptional regulator